jgi:uncharacterized membrane protein
MGIAILLHVLSATVWVGGMFFALACLRPAAADLEPAVRLKLWAGVLARFFRWVWLAIALLLVTGFWMTVDTTSIGEEASFIEHLKAAGEHVHIMMALGIVMMLMAAHVFFAPLKRLKRAVAESHWTEAGKSLNQVRIFIAVNLVLGLAVVAVAAGGRYFFR